MKPFGGIKIPIETTENIQLTCNQDAIDFLLDCDWYGQFSDMKHFYNNKHTVTYIIRSRMFSPIIRNKWFFSYVLLIKNPPPFMRQFKGQQYIIVASNLLMNMQRYFVAHKVKCRTTQEFNFIKYIIAVLDTEIINSRKSFKLS